MPSVMCAVLSHRCIVLVTILSALLSLQCTSNDPLVLSDEEDVRTQSIDAPLLLRSAYGVNGPAPAQALQESTWREKLGHEYAEICALSEDQIQVGRTNFSALNIGERINESNGYLRSRTSQATITFHQATETQCRCLHQLMSGNAVAAARSQVACTSEAADYELLDFVPQAQQALAGYLIDPAPRYLREGCSDGQTFATIQNCWSTVYEIARASSGGREPFTVFYSPHRRGNAVLTDAFRQTVEEHFVGALTATEALAESMLRAGETGDVLLAYDADEVLLHAAVLAAPGIVFQKNGRGDSCPYHHAFLHETVAFYAQKEGAKRFLLRRLAKTAAAQKGFFTLFRDRSVLPKPSQVFNFSSIAGYPVTMFERGRQYARAKTLEPFDFSSTGRARLPNSLLGPPADPVDLSSSNDW